METNKKSYYQRRQLEYTFFKSNKGAFSGSSRSQLKLIENKLKLNKTERNLMTLNENQSKHKVRKYVEKKNSKFRKNVGKQNFRQFRTNVGKQKLFP